MILLTALAAITASVLPQLAAPLAPPSEIPASFFQRGGHYGNYVSLVISPAGRVVECKLSATKADPSDDDKVCPQVRSATFTAASLKDGTKVYSRIEHLFVWPTDNSFKIADSDLNLSIQQSPANSPLHPRTELALDVDSQGKVQGCEIATSSGVPVLDTIACKEAVEAKIVHAVKDDKGVGVRSLQSVLVGFGAYTKIIVKKVSAYAPLGDAGPYFPDRAISRATPYWNAARIRKGA